MATELAKTYRPADVEPAILEAWNQSRAFHAEPGDSPAKPPYCIVIPPPNVTAALHMGHALNNTLQDILTRWRRMAGDNAVWIPGTDHAGIATQTVVEKRVLAEQGRRRTDFLRDEFVAIIQQWKDQYEATITNQLKTMGCSCDWERQRFTMDPVCAKAVREAFFRLFKDGLIYRGKRLVNWDPATQTALADDEVEMEEIDGHFYYLRYPLADGSGHVTVATTRPETMLGDTAVAMNPNDPRAAALRGKSVRLPIVNRIVPIIEDEYVVLPDPEGDEKARFSSGFLKVTPAHDPNDYELGRKHQLPLINVMGPDGSISKDHGWPAEDFAQGSDDLRNLLGMDRFEARRAVVEWFRGENLLEEVKPYRHSVGHSYRSHVPVEPYLSDQWYVKVTDPRLAGAALRAMAIDQRTGDHACPSERAATVRERSSSSASERAATVRERSSSSPSERAATVRERSSSSSGESTTYLLTFTCYGTWLHGDSRGSVDRLHNLPGTPVLAEDETREREEFAQLNRPPMSLDERQRAIVSQTIHEVCGHRDWRIHAGQVRTNHVHLVVTADAPPERVLVDLKAYATHRLVEAGLIAPDLKVWTRHGSTRYLNDAPSVDAACRYVLDEQGPVLEGGCVPQTIEDRSLTVAARQNAIYAPWEGQLRFVPDRYARTFQAWHENIRDWCISRQLWWGHRIPVWRLSEQLEREEDLARLGPILKQITQWVAQERLASNITPDSFSLDTNDDAPVPDIYICVRDPEGEDAPIARYLDAHGFVRDPDVLDTWFSSALWPISTLGWPEATPQLQTWNPSHTLSTAREILTLWVSRMVMFNLYFRDCLPFTHVFVHAMIQDGEGRKMSKSLGNGVDPLDIIHSHGSDAMRFTLAKMTTNTQDVRLPVVRDPQSGKNTSDKFDEGRNFANKLWNAVRFALGNLEGPHPTTYAVAFTGALDLQLPDCWILSRLTATIRATDQALAQYEFSNYAQGLYDFIWRDLCDWYIEAIKPTVRDNPMQRHVLACCIDATLRLLHPVMPFITEQLFAALNDVMPHHAVPGLTMPASTQLIRAPWPAADAKLTDAGAEASFELLRKIVGGLREVRTTYKVNPRQKVVCTGKADAAAVEQLAPARDLIQVLANVELGDLSAAAARPADAAVAVVGSIELYLHSIVDADAEKSRLTKRLEELARSIATLKGRLGNASYTDKAPAHLVQQTRDQLAAAEKEHASVQQQLASLA